MPSYKKIIALTLLWIISVPLFVWAGASDLTSTQPSTNQGKKWRIGYYEGGEYIDYNKILVTTVQGLMALGWIDKKNIPEMETRETQALWNWLATSVDSQYIDFVEDAFYSANWDENTRKQIKETLIDRLNQKKDIDLMIAMGTWAGQDLATDKHSVPTEVISSSDPIASGIIKNADDSGLNHLHAQVDLYRYERQVRVFHDMIGFDTMGICYEDTEAGRSYAAIDKVEKIARERGFNIVRAYTKSDVADTAVAEESVKQAFRQLVDQCQAIYVTVQGGVNYNSIPELVRISNKKQIPTFSQSGAEEVKYGFLASISQAGFRYIGDFHSEIIAKILNGAAPGNLSQHFAEPPMIALNLKTAEIIGYNPPVDILLAADEIFREIASPPVH